MGEQMRGPYLPFGAMVLAAGTLFWVADSSAMPRDSRTQERRGRKTRRGLDRSWGWISPPAL